MSEAAQLYTLITLLCEIGGSEPVILRYKVINRIFTTKFGVIIIWSLPPSFHEHGARYNLGEPSPPSYKLTTLQAELFCIIKG